MHHFPCLDPSKVTNQCIIHFIIVSNISSPLDAPADANYCRTASQSHLLAVLLYPLRDPLHKVGLFTARAEALGTCYVLQLRHCHL